VSYFVNNILQGVRDVRTRFTIQAQDVWDLDPISPVQ